MVTIVTRTGLLLIALTVASCAGGPAAVSTQAICSGWKPVTYSAKKDTPETVRHARAHNLFGIRRGCWKQGKLK